jgi:hypothetical protein
VRVFLADGCRETQETMTGRAIGTYISPLVLSHIATWQLGESERSFREGVPLMTASASSTLHSERRSRWRWLLILGIVLIILGISGITIASILELTSVLVFGPLLLNDRARLCS